MAFDKEVIQDPFDSGTQTNKTTISNDEVAKFSAMAEEWWDRNGRLKTLHDINPLRLKFITQNIFKALNIRNLDNIKILDIGCGGGLVSVPLAKMGANVLGIDASSKNVEIAKQYLVNSGLQSSLQNLRYECQAVEKLDKSQKFHVILALEVIEHVSDTHLFLKALVDLLQEEGVLIISTINRTLKSMMLAKVGAEYILRWLPIGTHDWGKFIKPEEIKRQLRSTNLGALEVLSSTGMKYSISKSHWYLDPDDLSVNYLMCLRFNTDANSS